MNCVQQGHAYTGVSPIPIMFTGSTPMATEASGVADHAHCGLLWVRDLTEPCTNINSRQPAAIKSVQLPSGQG